MQGPELLRLVDAIHRERNIETELLFQGLEHALLTAARKKLGESASISVNIHRETGDVRVIGPDGAMDLADLGRISAQTAKQVFGQIIREAEREVIYSEYDRFQRALVAGTVYRIDGTNVVVNLGRTEGYLPKHEQVRGETYRVGDRVLCYVVEVKKVGNRVKIILSRSHPDMIRRLFEREIPEVADGVVEIVKLVREAGYKTKVACQSLDVKVDPIGACVGLRGTRIKNIIEELNGEKIDIIRWSDSPEVLIVNALKPAQINSITLYEDVRKALVVVEEDQLSLAIGKKGANVRLASKLSDWSIDIISEAEARAQRLYEQPATSENIQVSQTGELVTGEVSPAVAGAAAEAAALKAAATDAALDEALGEEPAAETDSSVEEGGEEPPTDDILEETTEEAAPAEDATPPVEVPEEPTADQEEFDAPAETPEPESPAAEEAEAPEPEPVPAAGDAPGSETGEEAAAQGSHAAEGSAEA